MDTSLNQSTYERFKKDILSFGLKPGDTVSAAKVAKMFDVSRTPAREALVKLEQEGLVDIIPQSKSVISKINLDKAHQEWFIRSTLELAMVDKLFLNVTKADIALMKKYNQTMHKLSEEPHNHKNAYRYQMADNAFHNVTYMVAGEELSASVIAGNMANYSRLRFLTELEDYHKDRTVKGHDELIELLENKDKDGYAKALRRHLSHIINDIPDLKKQYPTYII